MVKTPLLTLDNISKTFRLERTFWHKLSGRSPEGIKALDEVGFTVPHDSILGIIGESGCGKTTLAKVLTRLEPADNGTLYYKARKENLLDISEKDFKFYRSRIQMIFQNPYGALNPRLSTLQTLQDPLNLYQRDKNHRTEAVRLMEMVGLTADYLERFPHEMSGGQRQRVNIARALAVQPEMLIADEPVSALDVSTQINILNLLKDIQQNVSLSYIFITHDLGIAKYICDQVVVMYLGQVVEWADKKEFFEKPLHPYSEMLIQSVPRFEEKNTARKAAKGGEQKRPDKGCLFAPRCPYVMELCRQEEPRLHSDKRQVRCFRYQ